ncbi:MAG: hypothetical protein H0T46_21935 [Deltaproteobacteria bacterium]|nr:hypothetical protein [Deltaproteobacteria bacterium]
MFRCATVLVLVGVLSVPGCATRNGRSAGYLFGTFSTFTGVVLTHQVVANPTECAMPAPGEPGDWCLGAIGTDLGRIVPPMMLASLGVTALIATAISSYIHRNDEEPRHDDRTRRGNLRYKRWDDAGRATRPR